MKHSIIVETKDKMLIKTLGLILYLSSSQSEYLFRPNLPMGKYRMVIDKVYPCETTKNHPIQLNWYFSKRTPSITEVKGNSTLLIPFDDTLALDYNLMSWGSTGGWVPNAYILNTKKACSNLKHLLGNAWLNIIEGFNIPSDKCPIPVGTYITSGFDKQKLEDMNFPKTFFFGKYKMVCRYKNLKNEVVGCLKKHLKAKLLLKSKPQTPTIQTLQHQYSKTKTPRFNTQVLLKSLKKVMTIKSTYPKY
ncbi:uncharacterized protein LOC107883768 [Acyrthosiphon pisum]|uniref:Uncharacterized protein n=1 Tax=Acyrthosiphon pisum TaxID=7029 RepID=A0A8R2H8G9_ACYPI|nr:uncharacterized protein LOC107883768 [Acyrthosiphon pisum]|eukprot:XP_016659928.1 PREDICTED: uncharacterized protein LOC107883768 [Acyrthosiphon pisum]